MTEQFGGSPEADQPRTFISNIKKRETRTPSGFVIPSTSNDPSLAESTLVRIADEPPHVERDSTTGLYTPISPNDGKRQQPTQGLYKPSDAEIKEHIQPPSAKKNERSGSDITLAYYNFPAFLIRELKGKQNYTSSLIQEEIVSHISNLPFFVPAEREKEIHPSDYSKAALERKTKIVPFYNRLENKMDERTTSEPGILENAAITIVDLLKETEFKGDLGNRALVCLNKLMTDYRVRTKSGFELPEMPDLVNHLEEVLPILTTEPENRMLMYDLLGNMTLSSIQAEEIVRIMDKFQDLDHALSYKLTLAIAEANPESPWIKEQQERRQKLLEKLNGTNQEMFDQYEELIKESRGLVFSGDLLHPTPGKVGMEIEYKFKHGILKAEADEELPTGWVDEQDFGGRVEEVKRSDSDLEYRHDYMNSLIALSTWLEDNSDDLRSFHLHFDRQRHFFPPELGYLYAKDGEKPNVYENPLGTWEHRGFILPKSRHSFHSARIADLIELNILAAKQETKDRIGEKLIIKEDNFSKNQLIFGHLSSFLLSSEARLAALMSLHDQKSLQAINYLSLTLSYEQNELLKIIKNAPELKVKIGRAYRNQTTVLLLLEFGYITTDKLKNNIGSPFIIIEEAARNIAKDIVNNPDALLECPGFLEAICENSDRRIMMGIRSGLRHGDNQSEIFKLVSHLLSKQED